MKAKDIEEILKHIKSSGMQEVNIETSEFKISVKKNTSVSIVSESSGIIASTPPQENITETSQQESESMVSEKLVESKQEVFNQYIELKSPMIGTFYRAANSEAEPFVSEGDSIKKGKTICIVEAMKIFNEIEAELSGKIVKILVEDATPVEFGQPLFLVDPS